MKAKVSIENDGGENQTLLVKESFAQWLVRFVIFQFSFVSNIILTLCISHAIIISCVKVKILITTSCTYTRDTIIDKCLS